LHKAILIVYSRDVLQPSGIRRFGIGVILLYPLWPVLRNGEPLIELLGNALTFERVLQRPTPSHLWTTDRPRCAEIKKPDKSSLLILVLVALGLGSLFAC